MGFCVNWFKKVGKSFMKSNDNLIQNISVANENKCYLVVMSKIKK